MFQLYNSLRKIHIDSYFKYINTNEKKAETRPVNIRVYDRSPSLKINSFQGSKELIIIIIIIYLFIYLFKLQMGFYPVAAVLQ
jgi:hypothetical protein